MASVSRLRSASVSSSVRSRSIPQLHLGMRRLGQVPYGH
jgi:hypothetical protein